MALAFITNCHKVAVICSESMIIKVSTLTMMFRLWVDVLSCILKNEVRILQQDTTEIKCCSKSRYE